MTFRHLIVATPHPFLLVVSRSIQTYLIYSALQILSLILMVAFGYFQYQQTQDGSRWYLVGIFALFIILAVPQLWKLMKTVRNGDVFSFNKETKTITKNHRKIATISEASAVQVRELSGEGDNDNDYRLSLVLSSGQKIMIEQCTNSDEMMEVARSIATFLNIKIYNKPLLGEAYQVFW